MVGFKRFGLVLKKNKIEYHIFGKRILSVSDMSFIGWLLKLLYKWVRVDKWAVTTYIFPNSIGLVLKEVT